MSKRRGLVYGKNPSRPGEPPHKQTGHLARSIAWEVEGRVARVGTNVKYGRMLEEGTANMSPRPYLHIGLADKILEIQYILSKPMSFMP